MSDITTTIAQKLEASRQELLDLTFRNPLLNYRSLRSRGVNGVGADPTELFRGLVREGRKLTFLSTLRDGEDTDDPQFQDPISDSADVFEEYFRRFDAAHNKDRGVIERSSIQSELDAILVESQGTASIENDRPTDRRGRLSLQTDCTRTELEKRLLATQHTARTFIEEQGVNTLFLALGMLHWYEADISNDFRRSPLLLIPVELERVSAGERFTLRYTEEEIVTNVSLATYLKTAFGIHLPTLPEAMEDFEVRAYLAEVTAAVAAQSRWSVEGDAAVLAFFSFNKYLMFKELEDKAWPDGQGPTNHPILVSLLRDGFREEPPRVSEEDHLDQALAPADLHTVVDADSSQMLIVEDVKQGRNLVVQGPPGTGKSQTITNVIAEALGQGKRVLFVSEKLAALHVVKQRLDRIGLGDACLELHSNKTNKRAVLGELRRTLDLGRPVRGTTADDALLMITARDRLNAYSEAVNAPVGASGRTLQAVYGAWLHLQSEWQGVELARIELPSTHLSWSSLDLRQREQAVTELQAHLSAMGALRSHPFWGTSLSVYASTDADDFRKAFGEARSAADALGKALQELARKLGLPVPGTVAEGEALAAAVDRAIAVPEHDGMQFTSGQWLARRADLEELLNLGSHLSELHGRYDDILVPEAWERDVLESRQTIAEKGTKWWRFVLGDWCRASKELKLLCQSAPPKEPERQVELLDAILEARRTRTAFIERSALGSTLFGAQWQGEHSRWVVLRQLLAWIVSVHAEVGDGKLPKAFLDFLAGGTALKPLAANVTAVRRTLSAYHASVQKAVSLVLFQEEIKFGAGEHLSLRPLTEQRELFHQWEQSVGLLQQMTVFCYLSHRCRELGLDGVIQTASEQGDDPRRLLPALQRAYYQSLLRQTFERYPDLANFSGVAHEQVITQFRQLDTRLLQHNMAALADRHWGELSRINGLGQGEGQLRVLTREFAKKTRHLPLRQLLEKAGNVIQAIKPVFMMSPLSVATFLAPGHLHFDLVVFDEASQVKPVDALGALARGKQAVVVGDKMQLPPTNFFDALAAADANADEETNRTADVESILEMFAGQGAPQRMLRWHYRSRHESLIAVSNQEFYENKLVIFPSPDAAREQLGLAYRYLPKTVYDRGNSGTNRQEARAVAEAVMAFAREQLARQPEERLTLGVAAFSVAQMQAILDQIEVQRRLQPEYEAFFAIGGHEPFFVKNLENVQGDERDVIYISIGYGRDKEGKVAMNFGPLNGKGGERRLNVLISRARLRCEVFTNLTAEDIDLNRTQSVGVSALRTFLAYARTGQLGGLSSPSGREPDSPFEREVLSVLRGMGHTVVPQVGCAGYFIDLAVVDPECPGRYLLGIECDGASYHSARSARDRDRLREEVLRRMGWRLYRIWSTDWIHRYSDEVRRLAAAVDMARADAAREREEAAIRADTVGEVAPTDAGTPGGDATPFARVDDAMPTSTATSATMPYVAAQLPRIYSSIYDLSYESVASMVASVVAVESPVHIDEVCRRIGDAAGAGRVTAKFRDVVERSCFVAQKTGMVRRAGDFLWEPQMQVPPLRTRAEADSRSRQLSFISSEEIALALRHVADTSYGISPEDAARSACRLLGFERITGDMKERVDAVIESLQKQGELATTGNVLKAAL